MARLRARTYAYMLSAFFLFSTVFVFSSQVLPPLSSFTYLLLRSTFGAVVLLVVVVARGLHKTLVPLFTRAWRDVVLFTIAFHALPLIVVFIATPLTNPTNQVIINNMNLTFVVGINAALFREKPARVMILAVLVNFTGALLVLFPLDFSGNPNLLGDLIMIGGVFIGAFFPIWNDKLVKRGDPLVLAFMLNALPALVLVPVLLVPGQPATIAALDLAGWGYIAWIGAGISGFAYLCGNLAYKDPAITPELYSTYGTLIPVLGMLVSIFLFGYVIGPVNLLGAVLVIASILLAQRKGARRVEEERIAGPGDALT